MAYVHICCTFWIHLLYCTISQNNHAYSVIFAFQCNCKVQTYLIHMLYSNANLVLSSVAGRLLLKSSAPIGFICNKCKDLQLTSEAKSSGTGE